MTNSSLYNRFYNSSLFKGGGKKNNPIQNQSFILLVFVNLLFQLLITYYVFIKTQIKDISQTKLYLIIISIFIVFFIIAFIPMSKWFKFMFFCLFSYLQGLLLSSIKTEVNSNKIQTAIIGTITIFGFMFAFGSLLVTMGIQLSNRVGIILGISLLMLILFGIINMFMKSSSLLIKIYYLLGLFLFSLYVLYDTNKILSRNYNGDVITASMDYYLDIINIFLDLISLNNN